MAGRINIDPATWRDQSQFLANINSLRQLRTFNDSGGIAVNLDVLRSTRPNIVISGSQSETLSLWETHSASGFVTRPKFTADLVTVRFVTRGHIVYTHRHGEILGSVTHATLAGFENLHEVRSSSAIHSISGTIALRILLAANEALTGKEGAGLPAFAPTADMTTPGIMALFCTIRMLQRRIQEKDCHIDLVFPLIQEVMSYQLLSAWPKRIEVATSETPDVPSHRLRLAIDYIEANLTKALTLSDIASASGVSVRSLQSKFRNEMGQTPVQFIIDRRMNHAHRDLISSERNGWSIAEIARYWGFTHISDFGQRYRRVYGCTPSDTRRSAGRG